MSEMVHTYSPLKAKVFFHGPGVQTEKPRTDKNSHVRRFEVKKVIAEFSEQKRESNDLPNMMASSVAVQGSGMISVSWLFSVGNTLAGVVLSKELVARFPLKKMGYTFFFLASGNGTRVKFK